MKQLPSNDQIILTAHQPNYFPYLGLFHKIALANLYCVFDIAQYPRREYCNRNKIKTQEGELWLSVPVETKDHFNKKIKEIKIIHDGWQRRHLRSITLAYKRAPYLELYLEEITKILQTEYVYLADLNFEILGFCLRSLSLDILVVKASDYHFNGQKSDLVLDMCVQLKADRYIFGQQGESYANINDFHNSEIKVYFQNYAHPRYRQLHGVFTPYLSILDLLFNEGSNSKNILFTNNTHSLNEMSEAT